MLARHTQAHQSYLIHTLTRLNPTYNQAVSHIQAILSERGIPSSEAPAGALGVIYRALTQQASMLAYDDVFRILGVVSLLLIPVMLLLKSAKGGAAEAPLVH
jgi:DHA2 family multidrug resistance protein